MMTRKRKQREVSKEILYLGLIFELNNRETNVPREDERPL